MLVEDILPLDMVLELTVPLWEEFAEEAELLPIDMDPVEPDMDWEDMPIEG